MKKSLLLLLITLLTSTVFFSCRKMHDKDELKEITLNITLARGTDYTLDLSQYGDADDIASIDTQAAEFDKSEIVYAQNVQKYMYSYTPNATPKFSTAGKDKVVLKITEPSGRCNKKEQTIITINFTLQ